MDSSAIWPPVIEQLWWLIPLAFLTAFLRSPFFKGWLGERAVRTRLASLDPAIYRTFHDVLLSTHSGTTQIDHVVVSTHGIFVIETKNMHGWIHGRERDKAWTQNIYGKKHRFQNPLLQNYRHVKALEAALGLPAASFHSIIVFHERATLKSGPFPDVIYARQLIERIRSRTKRLLNDSQADTAVDAISSKRLANSWRTRTQHVRELNKRFAAREPARQTASCPRCGSAMVLRQRRFDGLDFLGCSRFPACKGIRGLDRVTQS